MLDDLRHAHQVRPRRRRAGGTTPRLQLAIFTGGVIGVLTRAGLEAALPNDGRSWPWATLLVNVIGTFTLGYFVTHLQERTPPTTFWRPLLGPGLCGTMTTFSTFQIELIELVRSHHAALAGLYLLASVGSGLLGVYVATILARRVRLL